MTLVAIMGFKLCATTLFVLSLLIAFLSRSGTEGAATYLYHYCLNTNFTANSTYQSKLNNLLASLTSNATRPTGFYNTTASSPNSVETVYGLFLCRGDISSDDCRDCVSGATKDVVERCPREKEAVAWYDYCMLRYANQDFFSTMVTNPGGIYMWNTVRKSNQTQFDLLVTTTIKDLSIGVTNVGSGAKKFGTKEANVTAMQTLYTLAQCTPDLSGSDCRSCLQSAIPLLQDCCGKRLWGRVLFPSCNVRFEVYPFYKVNTSAPKPSTPALVPPPPGSVTKPKASMSETPTHHAKGSIYRGRKKAFKTKPDSKGPLKMGKLALLKKQRDAIDEQTRIIEALSRPTPPRMTNSDGNSSDELVSNGRVESIVDSSPMAIEKDPEVTPNNGTMNKGKTQAK